MDKFILPEYDNSIVSLASSIRRYFELDVYHNTLSDIDKILEEYKPKNVVVILFDGMGSRLIKKISSNLHSSALQILIAFSGLGFLSPFNIKLIWVWEQFAFSANFL